MNNLSLGVSSLDLTCNFLGGRLLRGWREHAAEDRDEADGDGGADPLPSLVNGCLAQLPADLYGVERRYLLRVEDGTRATMGRALPHVLPRVW